MQRRFPGAWFFGFVLDRWRVTSTRRLLSCVGLAFGLTVSAHAQASIVERVVAVVGERPILLTELQHRARPFLFRIYGTTQQAAQQAAHMTEMYKELINRMIDDRLEEQAADKAHLSVTPEEVDNALKNVSAANKMPIASLLAEAKRQGLSEQDYRDEVRRQVMEGKLVQLRVRGRVRVTEQDGRSAFSRWMKDTGSQAEVDVRILALRIPPGADTALRKARQLLAETIVSRARAGEDFCKLVTQFSDDQATVGKCGSRGPLPMDALVPEVQAAIQDKKEGDISDPLPFGSTAADEAILVVQLMTTPHVPKYDDVKDAMMDRAYGDAMEHQRKLWLGELRHGIYIDVRM
jgi:peptidyl-prolyl cis-trans isomerase SurA